VSLRQQLADKEELVKRVQVENELNCTKLAAQEDTLASLSASQKKAAQPPETENDKQQEKCSGYDSLSNCVATLRDVETHLKQMGYDLPELLAKDLSNEMQTRGIFSSIDRLSERVSALEQKPNGQLDFL